MAEPKPYRIRNSRKRAEAIEARGTGFRETTNLGQSPNSQGTLFQGGKPTAEHRWPRGYSPSRMEDIKDNVPIRVSHNLDEMSNSGSQSVRGLHGLEYGHPYLNPDSTEHTRRMIREPIARSTYAKEDLATLGGVHLRANAAGARDRLSGAAADYSNATRGIRINAVPAFGTARGEDPHFFMDGHSARDMDQYTGQVRALPDADTTLIHEVGHHVDFSHNIQSYSAQARQQGGFEMGGRGRAEATADAHMLIHFRNDPRNQRRTNFDAQTQTYGQRLGADSIGIPRGYQDPSRHAPKPLEPLNKVQWPEHQDSLWMGKSADKGDSNGRRLGYNGEKV